MRRQHTFTAAALLAAVTVFPMSLAAQDEARAVAGGGISVPGWQGRIDASETAAGQVLNNSKLARDGNALRVTTGPAVVYWHPDNKATGDYSVKATFTESKFQNLNNHPHPYGIVIGGNDMGTENQSYLYCATYGTGTFILRGFGPQPFRVNGQRAEANAAINKASAPGASVTQEIAVSVKGDKIECAVNGTVVGSYNKADVVTTGKLKSTDGIYGIRFGHNTEATVTGLTITKP
jgi:hypothetical protein